MVQIPGPVLKVGAKPLGFARGGGEMKLTGAYNPSRTFNIEAIEALLWFVKPAYFSGPAELSVYRVEGPELP